MIRNKSLIYIIILIGFSFARFEKHEDRIIDILLSHDKQYYVTSSKDGNVVIWDNYSDEIESIFTIDSGKVITNISLSFDNHLLAIGYYDGTIDILNRENQKIQSMPSQNNNKIILLRFIDHKHLLSCNKNDVIQLWGILPSNDIAEGDNRLSLIKHFAKPSSQIIAAKINSNYKNILVQLESGNFVRWDIGEIHYINIKEEQKLISSQERVKNLDPPKKSWWDSDPYEYYNFNISADGSNIAIVTIENYIIVWNSNFDVKTIHIDSHDYRLNDIIFSNDGKYLATCSIDKTLKIWDANNGELIKTYELINDWVTKVVFIDNMIICGTFKGKIEKYQIY